MEILYQDNRILVCLKPPGVLSTDEAGGVPDLLRTQLGGQSTCLRTVHRLDQVVGGVMVLARSREAARRLSGQIQAHTFQKAYLAVVHGVPSPQMGTFRDLLLRSKQERKTYVVSEAGKGVQEAILDYETLDSTGEVSLVRIGLKTGRTHQIRAQFSFHGLPLVGDQKYDAPDRLEKRIALWSHALAFRHPETEEPISFSAPPPQIYPWNLFPALFSTEQERGGTP